MSERLILLNHRGFNAPVYSEITRSVKITVIPQFLPDDSEPDESRYLWAYHIRIENLGSETVQLLNRSWEITDGRGAVEEVHGPGVVGEQPILEPGEAFEYTSGTPLGTSSGIMAGHYEMTTAEGRHFNATIPTFSLDSPEVAMRIN